MLTSQLRPSKWDEVAGQKLNIQMLKAIVKNPESSPRTIIMEGDFGSGKTTCARIMAKELNGIKDPNYDLNNSPFYYEYDSTVVGNVEKIRQLRDVFGSGSKDYWQVIVFDEIHATSSQAQTALLKILEDVTIKTFFILCTTHVHKVLPTIRSRSLELKFSVLPYEEVISHLAEVSQKLEISIPEDILGIIASRSGGHMRNAHMLLDKYVLIGEEIFRQSIKSAISLFCNFYLAVRTNNGDEIRKALQDLGCIPITDIRRDFSEFILLIMKCFNGFEVNNKDIVNLAKVYGGDIVKIASIYFSDWARNIFDSQEDFEAGMLCMMAMLRPADANSSGQSQVSPARTQRR